MPTPEPNSLTRFSNRVADYIRYRPGYPNAVYESLRDEFQLRPSHVLADVGSGTGISAEYFLKRGHTVWAVEPNDDMRAAAEKLLAGNALFHSVNGRAEASGLAPASVDWIIAAQAFHWFDVDACRREFGRVLRPSGRVALLWNERRDDTPFLAEYEALLHRFATDYAKIDHRQATEPGRLARFFGREPAARMFANGQRLDFDGLRGRLLSSSYVPAAGQPRFDEMIDALGALFARFARGGAVRIEYDTKLYVESIAKCE